MRGSLRRLVGGSIVLVTTLGIAVALIPKRVVSTHEAETQLVWDDHEAYLVIGTITIGWSGTHLEAGWQVIRNWLTWMIVPVSDRKGSITILRVAGHKVEEHTVSGMVGPQCSCRLRTLYCLAKGDWAIWTGTGFQRLTKSELAQLNPATLPLGDFRDVEGCSKLRGVLSRQAEVSGVTVELDGVRVLITATNEQLGKDWKSIDVTWPESPAVRVWHIDSRPRPVSAVEYQAQFTQ